MKITFASAAAVSLSLTMSALYLFTLAKGLASGAVFPATTLEAAVMTTMIARLLLIAAIPALRRSFALGLDILSTEMLAIPFLVLLFFLTDDRSFLQVVQGLFLAWPVAFVVVTPLFTVYRVARTMTGGGRLSSVLPTSVGLIVLLSIFDVAFTRSIPGETLSGVTGAAFSSIVGAGSSASIPIEVSASAGAANLILLVFALNWELGSASSKDSVIALAVIATLVATGWGFALSFVTTNAQLVFGAPAVAISALIWVASRGR